MRTRFVVISLTLLGSGALAAVLSATAVAQPVLPRVVQSSDGGLFVVQGANAWPLVPDQIDDAELATLTLGAEVNGTLPANLLTATAPAPPPPPAAAPAEPAPPAADTPAAPPPPDDTAPQLPATPSPSGSPAPLRRGVPPATPAVANPAGPGTSKRPAGPTPTPDPYGR